MGGALPLLPNTRHREDFGPQGQLKSILNLFKDRLREK